MNANRFNEMESLENSKYWLYAKTESELKELLDMFWGFHDFRIESVRYSAINDCIDVMLEYDTHDIHILLRFLGNVSMNFVPGDDYEADWLFGTSLGYGLNKQIVWIANEDFSVNEELPTEILWISSDKLNYAFLGDDGLPKPLPDDIIHQKWSTLNYKTMKYEETEHDFHPHYISG